MSLTVLLSIPKVRCTAVRSTQPNVGGGLTQLVSHPGEGSNIFFFWGGGERLAIFLPHYLEVTLCFRDQDKLSHFWVTLAQEFLHDFLIKLPS